MGQSSSRCVRANSCSAEKALTSRHGFSIDIKQLSVEYPDYEHFTQDFAGKFPRDAWKQLVWTLNEAFLHHRSEKIRLKSWHSAYASMQLLSTVTTVVCWVPFLISALSICALLMVLIICGLLTANGINKSVYLYISAWSTMSHLAIFMLAACYVMSFAGVVVLILTHKSLRALERTHVHNMRKCLLLHLAVLTQVYKGTARFVLQNVGVVKQGLSRCYCAGKSMAGVYLNAHIDIEIISRQGSVKPINPVFVMSAFAKKVPALQPALPENGYESNDKLHWCAPRHVGHHGNGAYGYHKVQMHDECAGEEGEQLQTEVSISLTVE